MVKFLVPDLVKILFVLGLILLLLRRKIGIGYVMFLGAIALILLYRMGPSEIAESVVKTVTGPVTLKLLLALSLIRMFEMILRERQVLSAMMDTVRKSVKSRRLVIVSMPLLIGMLPSLGGAYFSAPMVNEASAGLRMTQEEKAFVNYWFRHPWEYILPLYPGILLASALTGIPLYDMILANLVCALAVVATGFLFSMRSIGERDEGLSSIAPDSGGWWRRREILSFAPVLTVLLLVVLFRLELHIALLVVTVPLILFYRYRPADILRITRHGFALEVIVLISGVMFFKETMEASGAVTGLSAFFVEQGVPLMPVLGLLPFITGMLTGLTVGFVGGTFPLLLNISGQATLGHFSFAFAAGFIGVLLSPVHLCLVLTREYFRADLWGVYRRIVPASVVILLAAAVEYFLLV